MQRGAQAYFQTQVATTEQGDLVVMLYDGAINFLNRAKDGLAVNDMAGKGIAISKALDILNELESTLNMEKGGELARNLKGLYCFCSTHLARANLKKDPKMIDDVIKILAGLRSAYAAIAVLPEAQAAAREAGENLQVANRASQSGAGVAGPGTPAPGASARLRAMHAQNAGERVQADEEAQEVPPAQPITAKPDTIHAGASPAPVSNETPPAGQGGDELPVQGFAPVGGFGRRNAGAEMYRKFSGQ